MTAPKFRPARHGSKISNVGLLVVRVVDRTVSTDVPIRVEDVGRSAIRLALTARNAEGLAQTLRAAAKVARERKT